VRVGLVTVASGLAALAVAPSSAPHLAPQVAVSVTGSTPQPTRGREPLGRRDFAVSFHVSVSSSATCENLAVAYSYATLFNGRPSGGRSLAESFETGAPASSASFEVDTTALPAERVAFSAQGTCELEDGTVIGTSNRVARNVRIPAHSCEQGPLRMLAVRGRATRGGGIRVRAGQYLRFDDRLAVGRRSSVAFGATECRGFRVAVRASRRVAIRAGSYARDSRGSTTIVSAGATLDFRGDGHAGGIETPNAIAVPRGAAAFGIVATSAAATIVRVRNGAARVAARLRGSTYGALLVVRAGHSVRCASRACARR
jgi:hypothetical protein